MRCAGRWPRRQADLDFIRLGVAAFTACPSISLDYAVAEHTSRAAVVPADIGWSDVGSWGALWELGRKDAAGNVAVGDVLLEAARNCYVRSDGMLAAVVGLEDAVVVVTEDAVLAMHRDHAQDVKKVVDRLKAAGRHEAVAHNRVYRPWGFYESLIQGDRFQVKRIVVSPGRKLSLQKHFHRAEHWVVVNGSALVTRDNETLMVHENESVYLPLGCVHRLENPGKIPLALIEVQSGALSRRGRHRPAGRRLQSRRGRLTHRQHMRQPPGGAADMRLGRQVQAVEEHDHRHRDHRDAPPVQIRRRPAGEQQQCPRARQPYRRADHHLGRRMHVQSAGAKCRSPPPPWPPPAVPRGASATAARPSRRPPRSPRQRGRSVCGRPGFRRSPNTPETPPSVPASQQMYEDGHRPGRRPTPPSLREQCYADRERERQDHSLIGEIGEEVHERQTTRESLSKLQQLHWLITSTAMSCEAGSNGQFVPPGFERDSRRVFQQAGRPELVRVRATQEKGDACSGLHFWPQPSPSAACRLPRPQRSISRRR